MTLCGVHRFALDEATYCPFCALTKARAEVERLRAAWIVLASAALAPEKEPIRNPSAVSNACWNGDHNRCAVQLGPGMTTRCTCACHTPSPT